MLERECRESKFYEVYMLGYNQAESQCVEILDPHIFTGEFEVDVCCIAQERA